MVFENSNFDTIHTGKADPSRYLIIGFDTEYQRYADNETKTLNNEVLSYQYSCSIIEKDTEVNDSFSWSGLVKPKGPLVTDRLSLKEFLIAAVQNGFSEAQSKWNLPNQSRKPDRSSSSSLNNNQSNHPLWRAELAFQNVFRCIRIWSSASMTSPYA